MIKNGNSISYIYKVGSEKKPATEEDIVNVKQSIEEAIKSGKNYFVTHHNLEVIKIQDQEQEIKAIYNEPEQLNLFEP